ncbi:hypothetical protein EDC14_104415 [Hydrogenispora ethanolica]|uniref:Uncharacterized protein n=1 Tax=Hydrogenispora ethanolica TaxID=1082276 RepID=A0A4R1QV75_HYDET|nr:hypothetical protein EDC14_104415 [Hydrogenispora ethanolica]
MNYRMIRNGAMSKHDNYEIEAEVFGLNSPPQSPSLFYDLPGLSCQKERGRVGSIKIHQKSLGSEFDLSLRLLSQSLSKLSQSLSKLSQSLSKLSQSLSKLSQSPSKLSQSLSKLSQSLSKLSQSLNKLSQSLNKLSQSLNKLSNDYFLF